MKIQIQPLQEQIDLWIEKYVPEEDLFFLREEDLLNLEDYLHEILVIPKAEFFNHASYSQIQLVNSYEYWRISNDIQYVIVAQPDWITNLNLEVKLALFHIQVEMGRGLILPLSLFSIPDEVPIEYLVKQKGEQYVVLQNDMWKRLSVSNKKNAIQAYALEWDSWDSSEVPVNIPAHLKKYANSFSTEAGANCLAATIYAVSNHLKRNDWMIHEWVHQGTFIIGLKNARYSIIEEEALQEGDVVTWINDGGMIQHAAYHIGEHLFFNKNGQTFFNPWKIIHWKELNEEWNAYTYRIYRKVI
ncbi:hypothetical protein PB01_10305 [Psychrobacillus glaciei]|uniref:NlpC/P60 domain-containing protein n=1 Tax=Psychrobacillus glaciei TaxID=2283160 RepID=A0A5J6SMM5_9BACI|nr:hypothetical protein [Psychrobacillus glaciei]QFF99191.1 hypothetical protein PB01_10305 [Psychrobacillus glaciei]